MEQTRLSGDGVVKIELPDPNLPPTFRLGDNDEVGASLDGDSVVVTLADESVRVSLAVAAHVRALLDDPGQAAATAAPVDARVDLAATAGVVGVEVGAAFVLLPRSRVDDLRLALDDTLGQHPDGPRPVVEARGSDGNTAHRPSEGGEIAPDCGTSPATGWLRRDYHERLRQFRDECRCSECQRYLDAISA